MNYVKKLAKSLLYVLIPTMALLFILTIFNYFGIISYKVLSIIKYIILIAAILIGSYKFGINSKNKAIIEGCKFGLVIIITFILLNILFKNLFSFKIIIYYGIILATSILGSILGKNLSKK